VTVTLRIRFSTVSTAYAALAEFRRTARDLAWDLKVQDSNRGGVLVVPRDQWQRDPALREVATRYGGSLISRPD
jgi:hypothetical protein